MKGKSFLKVIFLFFFTGVRKNSLASTVPLKLNGNLTGNECFNHSHNDRIPYPGDCTKYLVCEFWHGTVMPCPGGLHFNSVMKDCSSASSAGCDSEGASTKTPTTTEIVPTLRPDGNLCHGKANGVLLSYPYDCNWYIRCENDASVVLRCEKGRQFNLLLQICDYSEYAQCIGTPYPSFTIETTSTPISTSPTSKSSKSSTTDAITSTTPIASSPTPESTKPSTTTETVPTLGPEKRRCHGKVNGALLSYPYDCDYYIRCEDDASIVLRCEKGRQFNELLQICDYPEYAQCVATPYPTTASPTNLPVTDTTPISTSPTGVPTNSPTTPEIIPTLSPKDDLCDGKANGALLSYPYDCNWYIRCADDVSIVLRCLEGRQFNEFLQVCDYPEHAQCTAIPYPTTTVEPSSSSISTSPTSESTESSTITITDTTPIATSPITEDSTNSPTTPQTLPTLGPEDNQCAGKADGVLLSYPYNCEWYLRCKNESPILLRCKEGRQFNANLSVCDYPENAQCVATPYPTRTTQPTTEQTESPTTTTKPSPSGSNVCCNAENGTLLAYPDDCTKYIECINPIPLAFQCREGLHYNAISQVCESIESARCQWYKPITCEDKEDGTVFPYSEDCTKYYYCSDGELVLLPCTIGAVFDQSLGNCVPGDVCPK